jgi:type 2 lantibiotic biosynthesis protein LanM
MHKSDGLESASEALLSRWCQASAQGDWGKFARRFEWEGWDLKRSSQILAQVPPVGAELPVWAKILAEVIEAGVGRKASPPRDQSLPFEDIYLPAVEVARSRLLALMGGTEASLHAVLTQDAYFTLERALLSRLSGAAFKTLYHEFLDSFGPVRRHLRELVGPDPNDHSRDHYESFVEALMADGLLGLFQKYPVLGRFVGLIIEFWVETTAEFLQRLEADLPALREVFGGSSEADPGRVASLETFLSDPHNRGRTVMKLAFESGLKLVYKPRDFGMEASYNEFLRWCVEQGCPIELKSLVTLNRETYGWVALVENHACADLAEVRAFYRRVGALMSVLYVLRATDCHFENLIASGGHPVFVDAETLFHNECVAATPPELDVRMSSFNSVLRTGMLPFNYPEPGRVKTYDMSAIVGEIMLESHAPEPHWKGINTNAMSLVFESAPPQVGTNTPHVDGQAIPATAYVDDILAGFTAMYRFLLENKAGLIADDGPLAPFRPLRARFVFRATEIYGRIQNRGLAPESLRSGLHHGIELEALARAFLLENTQPATWPILRAELAALSQFDIPHFSAITGSDRLEIDGQTIEGFLVDSYAETLMFIRELSEEDLARQLEIIDIALHTLRTPDFDTPQVAKPQTAPSIRSEEPPVERPFDAGEFIHEAERIAATLRRRSIRAGNGIGWFGLGGEALQIELAGEDLYAGKTGIALFLAALDHVQGRDRHRDLILQATQAARADWINPEITGIGGASGLGSTLYTLAALGRLTGDDDFAVDALRLAKRLTPEAIASDKNLDVLSGTAGALLGLLALFDQTGEAALLATAEACGRHLLESRVDAVGGTKAWLTLTEQPMTGFSHGAAGNAYALLRLYQASGREEYLEAARSAIAYEDALFVPESGGWPDLRPTLANDGPRGPGASWCHGAPGIGLARLGGLPMLDSTAIRQDIAFSVAAVGDGRLLANDQVCCGNLGRLETQIVASDRLSDPRLLDEARRKAMRIVARAQDAGGYRLFQPLHTRAFIPGFFQGVSGIGYQLLRLAAPQTLPSVLLWESPSRRG